MSWMKNDIDREVSEAIQRGLYESSTPEERAKWKMLLGRHPQWDHEMSYADCDCCGKFRPLKQVWYLGYMETWACAQCRGADDEMDESEDLPEGTGETVSGGN